MGRDGYYPLAILSRCASGSPANLPSFVDGSPNSPAAKPAMCVEQPRSWKNGAPSLFKNHVVDPSLLWFALCIAVIGVCVLHCVALQTARYWSTLTRDLDIREGDHPRRRCVYIHIGTAMLFSIAFVLSASLWGASGFGAPMTREAFSVAWGTFAGGAIALVFTAAHTWRYVPRPSVQWRKKFDLYFAFHCIAIATWIGAPIIWLIICRSGNAGAYPSFAGLFFSYRSLHPDTGVAPSVPVVLLMFGWCLWAFYQTWRLRFSKKGRPVLPREAKVAYQTAYPLYVSDEALDGCGASNGDCLFKNITCLLITRQLLHRAFGKGSAPETMNAGDWLLAIASAGLFLLCVFTVPFNSLDRFLWHRGAGPTLYEFLIDILFFPLVMVSLTGWLRMLVIWKGLRGGLLDRLEQVPLRSAFNRLKGVGWLSILRQGGLQEHWRDMSRSTESLRQLAHTGSLTAAFDGYSEESAKFHKAYKDLAADIQTLTKFVGGLRPRQAPARPMKTRGDQDLPLPGNRISLEFMWSIELDYAAASEALLSGILLPYWDTKRTGWVEADEPATPAPCAEANAGSFVARLRGHKERAADGGAAGNVDSFVAELSRDRRTEEPDPLEKAPAHILLAEEFLAIRYLSLIRAVLVNIRYLMSFVAATFVLAIVAWNSYPFQPRREIDWMFTALLSVLGTGMVYVLAQMHRDPILSRITNTDENKLGSEFWLRLAGFGGIPVLTWLAYQFPSIGGSLFQLLQPGVSVIK